MTMSTNDAINYLDNKKSALTEKNAPEILDKVTGTLYDNDYPDEVDDAVNDADLIFVSDVEDNPDDFIDDGYTKDDIQKIEDDSHGDYVMPDTCDDVDATTVKEVIDQIQHELMDVD